MILESEVRQALSVDQADLVASLGKELSGPQAFPLQPRELVERGSRWLTAQTSRLQDHICPDPRFYSFANGKEDTDDVSLVVELAKLLAEIVLPVNPVTLAALLAKRGLKEFCGSRWGEAHG